MPATLMVQSPCSFATGAATVGPTSSNHILSLPHTTGPINWGVVPLGVGRVLGVRVTEPDDVRLTSPLGDRRVTQTPSASASSIHTSAKHSTVLSAGSRQVHLTSLGSSSSLVKTTWPSLR